jgi:hypothetical protein
MREIPRGLARPPRAGRVLPVERAGAPPCPPPPTARRGDLCERLGAFASASLSHICARARLLPPALPQHPLTCIAKKAVVPTTTAAAAAARRVRRAMASCSSARREGEGGEGLLLGAGLLLLRLVRFSGIASASVLEVGDSSRGSVVSVAVCECLRMCACVCVWLSARMKTGFGRRGGRDGGLEGAQTPRALLPFFFCLHAPPPGHPLSPPPSVGEPGKRCSRAR